ncbi:BTAD domain-containing putative transcriptional regulator [Nonomuraea sp. NPDC049714]|uniref:BTAD domain-containing putative transcriptional regulator n=1 Tax=Nonomuraea sp. NPDC049714 TaxID=3364357 RepID=UPI0037BA07A2
MRFGVLGPLMVWDADGAPVTIRGLKVRALLADLLLHEGRPVSADRLVDDLWGDDAPANPSATLQVRVSQLRKALGDRNLVAHRPAGYLLQVEADAVDARRFTELTKQAQAAKDPGTRAALLADALALWRGPAFADFADEEFARAAIARLEEQRLTAVEAHAEARLRLGEHALLAGELADLVARHPLRERLRAVHLKALYRAGRQSEALDSYADLRERLGEELGLEPSPELAELQRAILAQDPDLAPVVRHATNLPTPLTELIGRDESLAAVSAQLGASRLVTLCGSGGVGKTRLAVETAGRLVSAYADGVWLVELASMPRSGEVAELVMAVMEIRDPGGEPLSARDRLARALRNRRVLLVLDNCEHVVEQVADLAETLLRAAPELRILATSREPLALAGEVVWDVPPLEQDSAVRLFAARAAAAHSDFRLDDSTISAVSLLCRRLDGIPLALELAATRVRALGVDGLVDRLDDRFRLLATGHRGAPPRQKTLTAMIDWSWELLTEQERLVLRRLAVHADGCILEAAEAVCPGDGVAADDVLDLLARLVDRSLVARAGNRFRLLESVAAYCVERMREAGDLNEVRHRHHAYYTDLAERAAPHLYGPDQRQWLGRLDAEAANLRAVVDGAHPELTLRLANALTWYWYLRGRLTEAGRSLETALTAAGGGVRSVAMAWLLGISVLKGGSPEWMVRRDQAAEVFAGELGERARAAWFLAFALVNLGEMEAGEDLLDRALEALRAAGDRWGEAAALSTRAQFAHVRGNLPVLEQAATRSGELFAELGDRWGQLQASAWLGGLAELTGDNDRAARLHEESVRMAEALGLWPEVSGQLAWLGWTHVQLGDYAKAWKLCERALRLATEQDYAGGEILAEIGLGSAARRQGEFDLAEKHLGNLVRRAKSGGGAEPLYLSMVLVELGFTAEERGDAEAARALHLEAYSAARKLDAPHSAVAAAEGLAGAVALAGAHAHAARLLGAAAASREATALPQSPAERADVDRIAAICRRILGEEVFTTEYTAGRHQTLDETIT